MEYGTRRTQIVMDYDDFSRVMEEFTDNVVNKVLELIKAEHPKEQDELMTAKAVAAMLGVTLKTLNLWDKRGFLPKVKIGSVVRYRRSDVERVVQVKSEF